MPDRLPETDNEILALFRIDKEEAWRLIYERCQSTALRFMRSQFRAGVDFEDVFQEACIVLYNKLQDTEFTLTSSIQVFINGVCKNILLKQYNRQPSYTTFETEYILSLAMEIDLDEEDTCNIDGVVYDVVSVDDSMFYDEIMFIDLQERGI